MCQQQFYFYPRSPCGERQCARGPLRAGGHFYPRSPCGERQCADHATQPVQPISIHALLAESDIDAAVEVAHIRNFYPRSPCGERRWSLNQSLTSGLFLSTLSLRRATKSVKHRNALLTISIHALLSESDCAAAPCPHGRCYFYPRSPCGERHTEIDLNGVADLFLSTLSLRRATRVLLAVLDDQHDFYPRSPCGERPEGSFSPLSPQVFLSTLSLRRATTNIREGVTVLGVFLSTLSLRRATGLYYDGPDYTIISIHALLAESDCVRRSFIQSS